MKWREQAKWTIKVCYETLTQRSGISLLLLLWDSAHRQVQSFIQIHSQTDSEKIHERMMFAFFLIFSFSCWQCVECFITKKWKSTRAFHLYNTVGRHCALTFLFGIDWQSLRFSIYCDVPDRNDINWTSEPLRGMSIKCLIWLKGHENILKSRGTICGSVIGSYLQSRSLIGWRLERVYLFIRYWTITSAAIVSINIQQSIWALGWIVSYGNYVNRTPPTARRMISWSS